MLNDLLLGFDLMHVGIGEAFSVRLCLHVSSWSSKSISRQARMEDGCKLREIRSRLEPTNMSWNPTRMDWNPCQFLFPLTMVVWMSCTHQGPFWCRKHIPGPWVKEAWGRSRARWSITGPVANSHQQGEPADHWQCVWNSKWLLLGFYPPNLP